MLVLLREPEAFCPTCMKKMNPHGTDIYSGRHRWRCDSCYTTTIYPFYKEVKGRKYGKEVVTGEV